MPLGVEYPDASKKPNRNTAIGIISAFTDACAAQCPDAACFIDTADTYCTDEHDYHAVESLLSEAKGLHTKRQMSIATKGGMRRTGAVLREILNTFEFFVYILLPCKRRMI